MTPFTDPRSDPEPSPGGLQARTTSDPDALKQLHQLCQDGRLYDVERWIHDGRPLQLADPISVSRRHFSSALEMALDRGDHALTHFLLCNGYDPNLERRSPLNAALRSRRLDLLDLLLDWGADPHRVDLDALFYTYDSDLFERFYRMGLDLTDRHAIGYTLWEHTSNKPLFGFAKRHRKTDPKFQVELNVALAQHAAEGNEKGVALSLWAGADPHAPACNLRWGCDCGEDGDEGMLESAMERACRNGNLKNLERLGPDPEKDDFDELYRSARTGAVVELLAQHALPEDPDGVIRHHVWWAAQSTRGPWGQWGWRSADVLKSLFNLGLRWRKSTKEEIADVRWWLLKTSKTALVDLMKLLATADYCAPEILHELGRTKAMRRRMKEVGFIPTAPDELKGRRSRRRRRSVPTRAREVRKKFGVEPSKSSKAGRRTKKAKQSRRVPRVVRIGWSHRERGRELRMTRKELYDRIWEEPVTKVAEGWGISDNGLRKQCRRLKIPLPGRGYWPKVRAGKKPRRPKLPKLPEGQGEEIVVWVPDAT